MLDVSPKSVLFFAPHLKYPCRDGADISLYWFIDTLEKIGFDIYVYSRHGLCKGNSGANKCMTIKTRTKFFSAIISLFGFQTYTAAKFKLIDATNNFNSIDVCFDFCIYSYLGIYHKFNHLINTKKSLIWTHNFDLDWYGFSKYSFGFTKLFYYKNYLTTIKLLRILVSRDVTLINVTEYDTRKYTEFGFNCITVSIGINNDHIRVDKQYKNEMPILGFVGSLGNVMNYESLVLFSEKYWHSLAMERFEFRVIGSNPSRNVINLINSNNWKGLFNLSNNSFNEALSELDYLIMPFSHNNGFKLKMMLSIEYGIPVLATDCIHLIDSSMGITSNDVNIWIDFIKSTFECGSHQISYLRSLRKEYTWDITLKPVINFLSYEA